MKELGLNEIREKFLTFFESKEHLRMSSFSLVPQNDNSLLLINSGMAPLKSYFTGQETPPSKRVTTCQKCIRTGDIENVGKTSRHGTFFEMLGNFSFGDYFKEEIIPWSWEFMTETLGIPGERLYVSVYLDDDEAYNIWNKKIGLSKERIFRMGKEDNFWEVGRGPCGPCSEIYYDKGEKYGCGSTDCTIGCDCDRYMEFWNLVFTQFNKNEDESYSNLPKPNIDTGMGLERMATIMQDVDSIFDVDTIKVIRDKVCSLAGVEYNKEFEKDVSIRIITDHIRSITFMTADGVLPFNEGRGYVLKRLLRRAARHGKLLGIDKLFLTELCKIAIEVSKYAYPELLEKQEYIFKVISIEEERFYATLDQGLEMLMGYIKKLKSENKKILDGSSIFKLYDTYGFPLELTKEILEEENLSLDEESFQNEMDEQRQRARNARENSSFMGSKETIYNKIKSDEISQFVGYENYSLSGCKIIAFMSKTDIISQASKGEEVYIILDKTPFYAESGGQKGDKGIISTDKGEIGISDCIKIVGNKIAHIGIVEEGVVFDKDIVKAEIDQDFRMNTARNHSATHLLQKALRDVLGKHVEQAGSYVASEKLRFDFTHFKPLTKEELEMVENIVNQKIFEGLLIEVSERTMEEARQMGAMALFGEKYGSIVRIISMGDFSMELCGGTHVSNTAQIGTFKIISESSAASGVRRIEALTGHNAISYYKDLEEKIHMIASITKVSPDNVVRQVKAYVENIKDLNKQVESLNSKMSGNVVSNILDNMEEIGGFNLVSAKVENMEGNVLRDLGDKLKDQIKSGIVVLVGVKDEKANIAVMATDNAVSSGINAGTIVKRAVSIIGGNGGGRPNMAMAGGKDVSKISEAIEEAKNAIREQLKV